MSILAVYLSSTGEVLFLQFCGHTVIVHPRKKYLSNYFIMMIFNEILERNSFYEKKMALKHRLVVEILTLVFFSNAKAEV